MSNNFVFMGYRRYSPYEPRPKRMLYNYTQGDFERAQLAGAFLAARKRRELEADFERVLHYEMFGRVLPRAPDPNDTQLQERGQVRDDVPANQSTEAGDRREVEPSG